MLKLITMSNFKKGDIVAYKSFTSASIYRLVVSASEHFLTFIYLNDNFADDPGQNKIEDYYFVSSIFREEE